jgi:3-methyladenine DNA glycosylase AlkD
MADRGATIDVPGVCRSAEQELRAAGTASRAEHEKAYLKSPLEHAGASLPAIRAVAGRIRREHPEADAAAAFAVAEALWSEPLHERRMLAVILLEYYATTMSPSDLPRLELLLRDSQTWAYIDGLAGNVAADIVLRHPDSPLVDRTLRSWAADTSFWVRRSALLAHLGTVGRKGAFQGWTRFCELADAMLDEREFFIRKATGWVLREAGKRRPDLVIAFLAPRTSRVSGVTLREAVRYLDPADRDALMAAYRGRSTRPQGSAQP